MGDHGQCVAATPKMSPQMDANYKRAHTVRDEHGSHTGARHGLGTRCQTKWMGKRSKTADASRPTLATRLVVNNAKDDTAAASEAVLLSHKTTSDL